MSWSPVGPLPETRFPISEAVDRLSAGGETSLYDALKAGLEMVDGYGGMTEEAIRGLVLLTDGQVNAGQVPLSQVIRVQDRSERDVSVGISGGPDLKNYIGGGMALTTKYPIHVFSVGVGEADWEVLRVFAEGSGGVVVRASDTQGAGLVQVLERFSKYF